MDRSAAPSAEAYTAHDLVTNEPLEKWEMMLGVIPYARPLGRTAKLSGRLLKGTLTAREQRILQNIADEFKTHIDIVGSRAKGAGRNIETDLPFGKGRGTRSDIDIRIDGQTEIDTRGALNDAIRNRLPGADVRTRIGDSPAPPYIRISPRKE